MLLLIESRIDTPEFTRELLRQKGSEGKIAERKNDRLWVDILQAVFPLVIYLLLEQGRYWEYQVAIAMYLPNQKFCQSHSAGEAKKRIWHDRSRQDSKAERKGWCFCKKEDEGEVRSTSAASPRRLLQISNSVKLSKILLKWMVVHSKFIVLKRQIL